MTSPAASLRDPVLCAPADSGFGSFPRDSTASLEGIQFSLGSTDSPRLGQDEKVWHPGLSGMSVLAGLPSGQIPLTLHISRLISRKIFCLEPYFRVNLTEVHLVSHPLQGKVTLTRTPDH